MALGLGEPLCRSLTLAAFDRSGERVGEGVPRSGQAWGASYPPGSHPTEH